MLLPIALLTTQIAVVLHPHVTEVAVYKPGLVYVTREAEVPKGIRLYTLDRVPAALDGSLSYSATDGAEVSELRTTINLHGAHKMPVTSITQLLLENVGKKVQLTVADNGHTSPVAGILLRANSESGEATLRMSNGNLRALRISSLTEASTKGMSMSTAPLAKVSLSFQISTSKPATIRFVSLELGAAWVANYRLDVHGNLGVLRSDASLGLGSLALSNTRVRLISGLPSLNGAKRLDLMTGSTSLAAFLSGNANQSAFAGEADPYDLVSVRSSEHRIEDIAFVPDGLFRRGESYGDDMMDSIHVFPSVTPTDLPQFFKDVIAASRLEDFHVYDFGKVSLPAGGRLSRTLSKTTSKLATVYRWDVGSTTEPGGFNRTLRLANLGKSAWPAGGVFVVSDEVPLAQVNFPFTPPGQEASLALGTAEDLITQYDLEEVGREAISPRPNVKTARVTDAGKLTVTNTRQEPVEIEIAYDVAGEVVENGGAKTTRVSAGRQATSTTRFTWRTRLLAGVKRSFSATFRYDLMN